MSMYLEQANQIISHAPKDMSAIECAKHFASDTYLMIAGARYVYLASAQMYLIIIAMNSIERFQCLVATTDL